MWKKPISPTPLTPISRGGCWMWSTPLIRATHQAKPIDRHPGQNALIQMCDNDLVVPNITTQLWSWSAWDSPTSLSPLYFPIMGF